MQGMRSWLSNTAHKTDNKQQQKMLKGGSDHLTMAAKSLLPADIPLAMECQQ